MRYHYQKPKLYRKHYGIEYSCNHELYNKCTLYLIGNAGLAIIQQRHKDKVTYWGPIDSWLNDAIYLNPYFYEYFKSKAKVSDNGLYPTITVRHIMHKLKMKPLPKARWETVFYRTNP